MVNIILGAKLWYHNGTVPQLNPVIGSDPHLSPELDPMAGSTYGMVPLQYHSYTLILDKLLNLHIIAPLFCMPDRYAN